MGGGSVVAFRQLDGMLTALRLVYRRPWENDVAPLEIFEVTVTVIVGEVDRDAVQIEVRSGYGNCPYLS